MKDSWQKDIVTEELGGSTVWVSYDPHAQDPGTPGRPLRLGGDAASASDGKKRAAANAARRRTARQRNRRNRSCTPLRCRSVAGTSPWHARARAVRVSPCLTRFGRNAHVNVAAVGGAGGVSLAALADAEDGSFRVALCFADHSVTLVGSPPSFIWYCLTVCSSCRILFLATYIDGTVLEGFREF